ncbi:sigma-70 family RNA polymerase sigma factor [Dyella sedimenti]|uniref:sigma-70 family RNA polymerase sigma factor n=1 Tax=Dyella sedimenti TaxID=2919947 RepID=UPI00242E74C2|nr:sigma-70 family RNA polymerase sigma factor [Dyella sedimenti]
MEESALWDLWRNQRDAAAREKLIARYSAWARQVARGVYRRIYALGDAWEDCAQNALIGLIEAIDRFDPTRGIDFEPYARHRVRGAVFNGLRQLRENLAQGAVRNEAQVARERIESLQEERDGDPVEAFVATTIGLGLGFLLDVQSLPDPSAQSDVYSTAERAQAEADLSRSVEALPDRERLVLTLHYYHHVPFVHIAEQLGVTKGRVSQLHKRALDRLRERLQEHWVTAA